MISTVYISFTVDKQRVEAYKRETSYTETYDKRKETLLGFFFWFDFSFILVFYTNDIGINNVF